MSGCSCSAVHPVLPSFPTRALPISRFHFMRRLRALSIELHAACRHGLLGEAARFEETRRPQPFVEPHQALVTTPTGDRKSTRLNSSHTVISYAVFRLKKTNLKVN